MVKKKKSKIKPKTFKWNSIKIILASCFGLLVWVGGIMWIPDACTWVNNEYINPLTLEPSSPMTIKCGATKNPFYIYLSNNTSNPLYNIEITASNTNGWETTLKPALQNELKTLGNQASSITIDTSVIRMDFNAPSKNVGYAQINNMPKKSSSKVEVEFKQPNICRDGTLLAFKVMSYKKKAF